MTDTNVQIRAGQNVGNEPSVLNFIEKAGSKTVTVPTNGQPTVILAGSEDFIRTNRIQATNGGRIFNSGPDTVDVGFIFDDGQGNQLGPVALGTIAPGEGVAIPPFFMCLAPGESYQITASVYGG